MLMFRGDDASWRLWLWLGLLVTVVLGRLTALGEETGEFSSFFLSGPLPIADFPRKPLALGIRSLFNATPQN